MSLILHPAFPSQFVAPRQIEVWLPPSYETDSDRRYAVLYMHDGQNVFNPATSTHKIPWGVNEAMIRLRGDNKAREAIVVAAWCQPTKRLAEYMPQKAFNTPRGTRKLKHFTALFGAPFSDAYLQFIIEELKPFIDTTYRTLPKQPDTLIMGSSMGGLISLYALCEYPHIFGGAGCVSTHWVIGEGLVVEYMKETLPPPGQHRLYFDYGTAGKDAPYEPYQRQADDILQAAGYQPGVDWLTQKFPGAEHNEKAWRARVHIPLAFLLGNSS